MKISAQQALPYFRLLTAAQKVGAHRLLRTVGVAINAEVRAAVIGADVLAGDAAAGRALARILGRAGGRLHAGQEGELPAGCQLGLHQRILRAQAADEDIVDTFVFMDAQGTQVDAFGAGGQLQPVRPTGVQGRDAPGQLPHLVHRGRAVGRIEPVQGSGGLAVHVHEAEDELFRIGGKLPPQPVDTFQQGIRTQAAAHDEGIATPDDPLRAYGVRQPLERLQTAAQGGQAGLQPLGLVGIEGVLEVELPACGRDLRQMRQEGRGMLAPEDEDARARKGDEALLATIEGIAPTAKARLQPGHEPLPMEGGDVRGPAGGDDERGVCPYIRKYIIQIDNLLSSGLRQKETLYNLFLIEDHLILITLDEFYCHFLSQKLMFAYL